MKHSKALHKTNTPPSYRLGDSKGGVGGGPKSLLHLYLDVAYRSQQLQNFRCSSLLKSVLNERNYLNTLIREALRKHVENAATHLRKIIP